MPGWQTAVMVAVPGKVGSTVLLEVGIVWGEVELYSRLRPVMVMIAADPFGVRPLPDLVR